ncbi:MAG: serine/threonine protein phosphatase [Candidatus Nitrosotenuis sp.]|nr:MAG: serine/threonine protein phosphatase [Candidatus Nitrosotenuis sp.]
MNYSRHFVPQVRPDDFLSDIDSTIKILQNQKNLQYIQGGAVSGDLIELKIPESLVIVGDLHGDLKSLLTIMHEITFQKFLANSNNKLIFLGDYINRGSNSIQVLRVLFYLKREYPDSVILLCGNHEAMERYHCSAHTLPQELENYFGSRGIVIYDKLLSLFRLLPKVTIIENQLLLVHGGVPTSIGEARFRDAVICKSEDILEELLWNDPRSDIPNNMDWVESRRGFGKHFGKNITKKRLMETGTKVIVRGHEPCFGFRIDHDDMVLTVFSNTEAYQKFDAAYVFVTKDELLAVKNASDLAQHVQKIKK